MQGAPGWQGDFARGRSRWLACGQPPLVRKTGRDGASQGLTASDSQPNVLISVVRTFAVRTANATESRTRSLALAATQRSSVVWLVAVHPAHDGRIVLVLEPDGVLV